MKYFCILFSIIIVLSSCMPDAHNKTLTYQNIFIISDMSDRLEPIINLNITNQQYPPKDNIEISKIISYFKNECVKPGEKIGDKSCLSFSTFSNENIACIDIDKIKVIGEKQQYINSTGKYKNNGLIHDIDDFKKKVSFAYDSIRNKGLDLISGLVDIIENRPIIKNNTLFTDGIDTTFVNFENHIYLFTDGYLEYLGKKTNNQFYFSSLEIDKVRQYCIANNIDIKEALNKNSSLGLPPVKSKKHELINLHVLETHERDKNNKLQTYTYHRGLRDNEILEAVWRKWALESDFKSFEWKKY